MAASAVPVSSRVHGPRRACCRTMEIRSRHHDWHRESLRQTPTAKPRRPRISAGNSARFARPGDRVALQTARPVAVHRIDRRAWPTGIPQRNLRHVFPNPRQNCTRLTRRYCCRAMTGRHQSIRESSSASSLVPGMMFLPVPHQCDPGIRLPFAARLVWPSVDRAGRLRLLVRLRRLRHR